MPLIVQQKGSDMFNFLRPSGPAGARVERMEARDAVAKAATGEIVVIDVRDSGELRSSGKAKGALHVPLMVLRSKCDPANPECLAELKSAQAAGTPIAVYCASGGRSQGAGEMLLQMGYGPVYNIGGLYDWHAAGGELVQA